MGGGGGGGGRGSNLMSQGRYLEKIVWRCPLTALKLSPRTVSTVLGFILQVLASIEIIERGFPLYYLWCHVIILYLAKNKE